jgi:3-oxoacyl-[acyl-carrier protein] reductase
LKKTVLITGASGGIGLATVKKFLSEGFTVIAMDRDFTHFEGVEPDQVEQVSFDLRDIDQIPALVEEMAPIDVLINNAGIMLSLPYDAYPEQQKHDMIKINIEAPVALIREASRSMISKGTGRIVNNASIAGQIGHPDVWYGITKAGVINMTKSFAKILGPYGIVVNAVACAPVQTKMLDTIPKARKDAIKESVISNRFAMPEEVAQTMFWLATDCPEYINGTCIDINNGAFPR